MATSSNRDVRLSLGVDVTGTADLQDLSTKVRDLAKAGGAAAPEFEKLADEIDASIATTKRFRDAEKALQAETAATKLSIQAKKDALKLSNIETDSATRKTVEHKAAVTAAKVEILQEEIALRGQKNALTQASAASAQAATAEKALAVQARATLGATQQSANEAGASVAKVTENTNGLNEAFKRLGPIIAASFTGREFVNTIVQAESLKRGLTAITGSSQAAAAEIEYLRRTTNELGLDTESAGKAYLSLTAATRGTAIDGEKTRALFEAISRAMGTLGKSSAETERALTAVQQMASKGTVSMEELRGQLAESLPTAMQAAADGAGLTVAQLIKMVETGDVLAKDLLPALTKGLDDLYAKGGPPDGIISNWNRLSNAVKQTAVEIGEGGAGQGLTKLLGGATVAAVGVSEAFGNVGKDIGEFAGAVASGNFDLFTQAERLKESEGRLNRVSEAAGFASTAAKGMGDAAAASGTSVQEAFRKSEIAAQNAGAAVEASALQQKQAFIDLEQAATKRLEQSKKSAEAADAEAKTIGMIAAAFGNETDKLTAATLASTLQRDAQVALTTARRDDLVLAEQKLAALAKEIAATQKFSPELDTQRKALEASVAVKREEVRASDATAKSHDVAATSARVAAEAYKDNSTRVGELKMAYDLATVAVDTLRAKQKIGQATTEEVSAAVLKQAAAQKLYTDALRDSVEVAEVHEKVLARKAATSAKEIDLNIEAAKTTLEVAKARGDDTGATRAQIDVTNLEVDAKRQAAQALRDEAAAMRETAVAREREAAATGTLTTAKKEEIAAIRASADGKDLDAKKSDLLAEREAALARATQSSAETFVSAMEKKVSAQEKLNAVMERADALERKRLGVDKEGFATDKSGQRIAAGSDLTTLTGIAAFLKTSGVEDDATARNIAREFADANGNISTSGSSGQMKYGGKGSTISYALIKAAERYTFGADGQAAQTPATIPAQSTTHNVNITLPDGSRGTVNVASANDATTLSSILQQLGTAKRVS